MQKIPSFCVSGNLLGLNLTCKNDIECGAMANEALHVDLSLAELRAVVRFAARCARPALHLFEDAMPGDWRPRAAIDVAEAFATGARRTKGMRDKAWAALRAAGEARDAGQAAAFEVARAATAAAGAAYLHPIAKATQVKHILGSAAHAAIAFELAAGGTTASDHLAEVRHLAEPMVIRLLRRYPAVPSGGGRAAELMRELDQLLIW
jgi:hypothetical protein